MRIILFILVFISTSVFSQGKYALIKTIEAESDFFTTDNQSNVYTVKANELTKYNKDGKLLYKYSNKNYGNITSVDASNMLRILVFYKQFSQVVFLDNTLSENGEVINLIYSDLFLPPLVCSSYDNGMWVYDLQSASIIRFDKTVHNIQNTVNLAPLALEIFEPISMIEYDNRFYVNNPSSGILIFDIYGTYYKTLPIKNSSCFQVRGDWVYYLFDKKVKAYNIKTTEEKEFEMPISDFKSFRLEMDILMLQSDKSIALFSSK